MIVGNTRRISRFCAYMQIIDFGKDSCLARLPRKKFSGLVLIVDNGHAVLEF